MKRRVAIMLFITMLVCMAGACGQQKEDTSKSNEQTSVSQEVSVSLEDTDTSTAEVERPQETDKPEVLPEVFSEPAINKLSEASKHAFCNAIWSMFYKLEYYYWQGEYSEVYYGKKITGENRVVSLQDVNGDGKEELFTISCEEANGGEAVVKVYEANEKGDSTLLISFVADTLSDKDMDFALIASDGKTYLVTRFTDEEPTIFIEELRPDAGGNLELCLVASKSYSYVNDHSDNYIGDAPASDEEFEKFYDELFLKATNVVLNNKGYESDLEGVSSGAMCFGQAMRLFNVNENAAEDELPFYDSVDFCFTSGVGAWSTDMTLLANGAFNGMFHDADMGDIGEGYENGTYYTSIFEGNFKNIRKVNDYVYEMYLDGWTQEETPDEVMIADDMRYIGAYPYGIYGGDRFEIYLPGTPIYMLPESYIGWVYYLYSSDLQYLPFFGMYNVEGEYGFF